MGTTPQVTSELGRKTHYCYSNTTCVEACCDHSTSFTVKCPTQAIVATTEGKSFNSYYLSKNCYNNNGGSYSHTLQWRQNRFHLCAIQLVLVQNRLWKSWLLLVCYAKLNFTAVTTKGPDGISNLIIPVVAAVLAVLVVLVVVVVICLVVVTVKRRRLKQRLAFQMHTQVFNK